MSEYVLADKKDLTAIANALRINSGESTTYSVSELSTAAIKTISTGGGGGNVQADWNENDSTKASYVKNRTHWEELEETELFNQTITLGDNLDWATSENLDFIFSEGETYIVNWEGIDYEVVSTAVELEGVMIQFIGDIEYIQTGGESTSGIPFCISADINFTSLTGATLIIQSLNPNHTVGSNVNCKIIRKKITINKIDPKFIQFPEEEELVITITSERDTNENLIATVSDSNLLFNSSPQKLQRITRIVNDLSGGFVSQYAINSINFSDWIDAGGARSIAITYYNIDLIDDDTYSTIRKIIFISNNSTGTVHDFADISTNGLTEFNQKIFTIQRGKFIQSTIQEILPTLIFSYENENYTYSFNYDISNLGNVNTVFAYYKDSDNGYYAHTSHYHKGANHIFTFPNNIKLQINDSGIITEITE